ncbi:MAG: response regulator transcription factor [Burkholderiales bacterium]
MIAVVDDDAPARRALGRLLKAAGYKVAEYSSGASFLSSLVDRRPLCLILDLHMPQMSGFEVQVALARGGYDIPVIVTTGDFTPESVERATKLGAAVCLPKPVDAVHLLEAVREACGGGKRLRSVEPVRGGRFGK